MRINLLVALLTMVITLPSELQAAERRRHQSVDLRAQQPCLLPLPRCDL